MIIDRDKKVIDIHSKISLYPYLCIYSYKSIQPLIAQYTVNSLLNIAKNMKFKYDHETDKLVRVSYTPDDFKFINDDPFLAVLSNTARVDLIGCVSLPISMLKDKKEGDKFVIKMTETVHEYFHHNIEYTINNHVIVDQLHSDFTNYGTFENTFKMILKYNGVPISA